LNLLRIGNLEGSYGFAPLWPAPTWAVPVDSASPSPYRNFS